MSELTLAPAAQRAPDYDQWAAYWQEMRKESLILLGEAFDHVAEALAAGEARAAVDVLTFCADETGHGARDGVWGAIAGLMIKHSRVLMAAEEIRNGCSMTDVIEMVNR